MNSLPFYISAASSYPMINKRSKDIFRISRCYVEMVELINQPILLFIGQIF
jgi:hypothetical protein